MCSPSNFFKSFLKHWDLTSYFSRTGDTRVHSCCWDTFILKDTGWSPDWGGGISCCSLDCVGPLEEASNGQQSRAERRRAAWQGTEGFDCPHEDWWQTAPRSQDRDVPSPLLLLCLELTVGLCTLRPMRLNSFQKWSRCSVTSNYDQVATGSGQYRQVSKSHRLLGCSIRQT